LAADQISCAGRVGAVVYAYSKHWTGMIGQTVIILLSYFEND